MNMMFYSEIKGAQFALLGRVGNNFYSQQTDWCNVQECRDECLERWCAGFREIREAGFHLLEQARDGNRKEIRHRDIRVCQDFFL